MKYLEMNAVDIAEFILNPSWSTQPTGHFPSFEDVWNLLRRNPEILIDQKVSEVERAYLFHMNGKYKVCNYERGSYYSEKTFENLQDAAQEKALRIYTDLDLMRISK